MVETNSEWYKSKGGPYSEAVKAEYYQTKDNVSSRIMRRILSRSRSTHPYREGFRERQEAAKGEKGMIFSSQFSH